MPSPKVNKIPYDFASLELALSDDESGESIEVVDAFDEIEYSDNVDREKYWGTSRTPQDETEGVYDAEGSVQLRRDAFQRIHDWAAQRDKGFYDLKMTMTVTYGHKNLPLNKDTITKVRFASRENSHSQGPEHLVTPCDLFIGGLIYINGRGPFGERL